MSDVISNYTTSIDYHKTIGEIQGILVQNGADKIMIEYENKSPIGLKFIITKDGNDLAVYLPSRPKAVQKILREAKKNRVKQGVKDDFDQACRVAWRIMKDWVKVQMDLIQTEQAEMAEVFMPYLLDKKGRTMYQALCQDGNLLLQEGR